LLACASQLNLDYHYSH